MLLFFTDASQQPRPLAPFTNAGKPATRSRWPPVAVPPVMMICSLVDSWVSTCREDVEDMQ